MSDMIAHHGLFKNTKLHVDDTGGSGRAVVLIHGWPMSGESWKAQVPALQGAGYRVVTYDRRGFGRSDKPRSGYNYDMLSSDLHTLIEEMRLIDVTVVGFSMGGGEVARYFTDFGADRLRSLVFASSVTPFMMQSGDNPEGSLTMKQAAVMATQLTEDEDKFYEDFTTQFFSANGELKVTEAQRQEAIGMCKQADKKAALECMAAFGNTDFREDLLKVSVPALILHGDCDATVPYVGSGERTHEALPASEVHVIEGGPHGCNVSHASEWNRVLLEFLAR